MRKPRDLTAAQFNAELRCRGFRRILLWVEDTTGVAPGVSFGVIVSQRTGKILRRATLAKVLRERALHEEEMPWCERCGSYHSDRAPHIKRSA